MTLQDLRDDFYRELNLDSNAIDVSDVDFYINEAYKTEVAKIDEVAGYTWRRKEYTFNLQEDVSTYDLSSITDLKEILRVEVNYSGNQNSWQRLFEISERLYLQATSNDISISGYLLKPDENGVLSIIISPTPSQAITNGGKIVYIPQVVKLSNSTDVPIIEEDFQRVISLKASFDYASSNEMNNLANNLLVKFQELETKMLSFYANYPKDEVLKTTNPLKLISKYR